MRNVALIFILACLLASEVFALAPGDLARVRFEQHPGRHLSPDLVFRDENDRPFRLADHFGRQPTVLVPGYYRCPMLCTLINDGLISALQELRLNVGRDFQVIDVSIDPAEKPAAAAARKREYLRRYGRDGAGDGWHCLVGDESSIAKLTDETGYRYLYDEQSHEYAHPSGIIILTPDGKISRYLSGVNFDPKELLNALVNAKQGQTSSAVSQILLLCYHYNPLQGKYGTLILSTLRVVSVAFLAAIVAGIVSLVRRPLGRRAQSD